MKTCWTNKITAQFRIWLQGYAAVYAAPSGEHYPLHPQEIAAVAHAMKQRRADFIAARWCAHRALDAIGKSVPVIAQGALGRPQWPTGVTGSITHESGICIAMAARTHYLPDAGIDLFDSRRSTDMQSIKNLVLAEREHGGASTIYGQDRTKLIFCIKEAVIKAVSLYAGRFMDMRDIVLDIGQEHFAARIDELPTFVYGYWSAIGPFLLSLGMRGATQWHHPHSELASGNPSCIHELNDRSHHGKQLG
ncbi:MAG: hypothetical protein WAN92_08565 [Herbaspirillum sp.]